MRHWRTIRWSHETTIDSERYSATLEYPVKTMNANERDMIYQADTGPLLLPDFDVDFDRMLEGMELAFAAFNGPHWIEMLVRVPTKMDGDISVYHYSRAVRLDAKNEIIRLAR